MKKYNFDMKRLKQNHHWQTPQYIIDALGEFDLDPCPNRYNPTRLAKFGFVLDSFYLDEGGLIEDWFGRVWLNPPYGQLCKFWMQRFSDHGNGIALIPPRVGSKWFHDAVFKKCDAILFLEGRISFLNENLQPMKGNNSDSCLIAFGDDNVTCLEKCNLKGKMMY